MVERRHDMNILGWKASVSEYLPRGSSAYNSTEFLNFDVYGRPTKIRPPDGSAHDIDLVYNGDRLVTREVPVATSLAGTETVESTTETYDVFGRLVKVQEPSAGVTANYEYDAGNRLKHAELVNGTNRQHRYFAYDGRGFLLSETHPEKGGSVTYGDYDARGHAGYRYDTTAARGVEFDFDSAERLLEVRETSQAGGRLLKKFTYDSATGWGNGKLATAAAWNYPPDPYYPEVRVTESYSYGGREGRISSKSTQFAESGIDTERHDQSFTWSPGGELLSESYPVCTGGVCSSGQPARVQNYGYAHGVLGSVEGWASAIGYHESGMVASVTHTNGTADTISEDGYGRARPAQVKSVSGATTLFDSGAMTYDGAGNIEAMGASRFRYDGVSRLAEAEIVLNTGTYRQSYALDGFGNLQSITTTPAGGSATTVPTPTSVSTNRLSSGTYDVGGNLTNWNGNVYTFDVLNRMTRIQAGAEDWFYVYTADDERVQQWSRIGQRWTTIRGLDAQVRRVTRAGTPTTPDDYLYRGGQILAKVLRQSAVQHFHLDHLGSTRRVTDAAGAVVLTQDLYPYGEEIVPVSSGERTRFTGHERDTLNTKTGTNFTADDLDYVHARFNSPLTGRFLAVDPANESAAMDSPQTWNRYAYADSNPLLFVDPDGQSGVEFLVKALDGAYRVANRSTAVRVASKRPHAVKVVGAGSSGKARRLAREANPDASIVRHDPHRPGDLQHYQPSSGGTGHVGYSARDIASGPTLAHYAANQDSVRQFLAELVDFVNPLSIGQDMFDLGDMFMTDGESSTYAESVLVTAPPLNSSPFVNYSTTDPGLFPWGVAAHGHHTGNFVSTYDLFRSGAVCIEGVCR
jgi:RHS repeat-associated protein